MILFLGKPCQTRAQRALQREQTYVQRAQTGERAHISIQHAAMRLVIAHPAFSPNISSALRTSLGEHRKPTIILTAEGPGLVAFSHAQKYHQLQSRSKDT